MDASRPREEAVGVEHPPGVLVAAVDLVEDLQQVRRRGPAGRRLGIGAVPERAPVVLERRESIGRGLDATARVGEGERRPVAQVLRGRGTVPGDVARRDLRERLVAVEPARTGRAFGDQRVGVLAFHDRSAAEQRLGLGARGDEREGRSSGGEPDLLQVIPQLGAGAGPIGGDCVDDRVDRCGQRAIVDLGRPLALAVEGTQARSRELREPDDIVGPDEVPRGAEHVEAQDVAPVERVVERESGHRTAARRDRPARLGVVLGLHGEERTDDRSGVRRGGPSEVLGGEAPPCEIAILHRVDPTVRPLGRESAGRSATRFSWPSVHDTSTHRHENTARGPSGRPA